MTKKIEIKKRGTKPKHEPLHRLAELPLDSKMLLGILIPLLVIVVLVVLSSLSVGFSVSKDTVNGVRLNQLLYDTYDYNAPRPPYVHVQTITIANDYILPKKYELPRIAACLNGTSTSFRVIYVSSDFKPGATTSVPILSDLADVAKMGQSYYYYDSYGYDTRIEDVDVSAKGKKEIRIYVEPQGVYQLSTKWGQYYSAASFILVEVPEKPRRYYSYYDECQQAFSSEQLERAQVLAVQR